MLDFPLLKIFADMGAIGISLIAVVWLWVHNRDDVTYHKEEARIDVQVAERLKDMEAQLESFQSIWARQDAANHYSAQSDQQILTELGKLAQRVEAVSTRVDSLSNTVVELKSDVRHLTERRER